MKMISDVALQEFKELYCEEFGGEISDEKAMELATNLLTLFNRTYRPVRKEWLKAPPDEKDSAVVIGIKN